MEAPERSSSSANHRQIVRIAAQRVTLASAVGASLLGIKWSSATKTLQGSPTAWSVALELPQTLLAQMEPRPARCAFQDSTVPSRLKHALYVLRDQRQTRLLLRVPRHVRLVHRVSTAWYRQLRALYARLGR